MRNDDDRIFYGGYGAVFIALGIWIVFWALEAITASTALLLWLMTIGIITLVASGGSNAKARRGGGMNIGIIFGFFMIILSISLLGAANDVYSYWVALGMIIVFTGLGVYSYGLSIKN